MRFQFIIPLLLLSLAACAPKQTASVQDSKPKYTVFNDTGAAVESLSPSQQGLTDYMDMLPAIERSLAYVSYRPAANHAVTAGGLTLTWGQIHSSLRELRDLLPELDRNPELLEKRFTWFRLDPGTLLTGYYEPLIRASAVRTKEYRYPIYGLPPDLKTLDLGKFHPRWKGQKLIYRTENGKAQPYFDREHIDGAQALSGKGLELAWLANPVDSFFLQIQGSGRLIFPDGSMKHVLYAGKNGRQYRSLGRILINDGRVTKEEMSMKRIRRFLADHPEERDDYLYKNPSYVFFRLDDEGPYGSIGRTLTPYVSVAVDPKTIPMGAPLILRSTLPGNEENPPSFNGLMLAQDTGGAIKRTRCDLFCGFGPRAEYLAGHLQNDASIYLLISKKALGY